MFEAEGKWQGIAEAQANGLIIVGQRTWSEWDPNNPEAGQRKFQENGSFRLSWDSFEYAVVSDDGSLQLTPVVGFSVLAVILSDFDERGRDPWVALLREHGVAVN